ncbi:phage tail tip fiber protein [Serratia symbiotica]|uniref:phage tail tip fiber protein n=1 Tax=Serratia symbiotica TaxID=138074 RepID=UPI000A547D63|nr:hypothetical protein [Serratia symbiotica]
MNAAITSVKIADAAITNAKIGGFIQSDNYVEGYSGWRIDKSGGFKMADSYGGSRITLDGSGLAVHDNQGVQRVKVGRL